MDIDLTYNICLLIEPTSRHHLFQSHLHEPDHPPPTPTMPDRKSSSLGDKVEDIRSSMAETKDSVKDTVSSKIADMQSSMSTTTTQQQNLPSATNMGSNTGNRPATSFSSVTSDTSYASMHATDARPEDLPFDAQPGTDEEFGIRAAISHVQRQPRKPKTHEKIGDDIEGVLLR